MSTRSDWLRLDGMLTLDHLENWEGNPPGRPVWDPNERPLDPMAWRVRQLMEYLNDKQKQALEDKYFLNKSTVQMAEEYGCTERAVRGLLARARGSLVKAFAQHGEELLDVPREEW